MAQTAASGDAGDMVPARAWVFVAIGAVLVVSVGAGSVLLRRSDDISSSVDSSPFPVGQVFTLREWSKVKRALVAEGFGAASVRVVSGDRLEWKSKPFALVRATSPSRGVCFLPVSGLQPGAPSCSADGRLAKPLLVFSARDRWGTRAATLVVGVVRHAVTGVSVVDRRGVPSGVALIPATGGLWSFASGYGSTRLVVRARSASGRVIAQTALP